MGLQLWSAFTAEQRKNIAIYVLGIMCYKVSNLITTSPPSTRRRVSEIVK